MAITDNTASKAVQHGQLAQDEQETTYSDETDDPQNTDSEAVLPDGDEHELTDSDAPGDPQNPADSADHDPDEQEDGDTSEPHPEQPPEDGRPDGDDTKDITFSDISEEPGEEQPDTDASEDPNTENAEEGDNAGSSEDSEASAEEQPKEPTAETVSFHVHRTLATGRAVITVKTSDTDPFFQIQPNLPSLADAIPLLPEIYQAAAQHWESKPRYPDAEAKDKPPAKATASRPTTPSRPAAGNPAPAQGNQQASLNLF